MNFQMQAFVVLLSFTTALAAASPTKLQQANSPSPTSLIGSQTSSSKTLSSVNTTKAPGSKLSQAASVASGSPSLVSLRNSGENKASATPSGADLDAFDGKNPFADDSLWQIPVHLVRDLSSTNDERLAKSASESSPTAPEYMGDIDGDMDSADESEVPNSGGQTQSSSSSPTIISASTDLKTAAGYHYPSSHGHQGGYHGGHHGGEHYGGKYFQYASVPYPYAWDFGYKRGNPYHTIERYEHGKGPHFQTKVKWSDKHGGYGVHVWDYNHDDHHSHHYDGGHHGGYESHGPSNYGSGHHGASRYGHH